MNYRYLPLAEWQVCAALAGQITQIRVPVGLWRVSPKPGALIWVQEPFIHYTGKRRDKMFEAIGYRADAGPAGGFPPMPELRNRQVSTAVCAADKMWRDASRLTLEVARCWTREWSYWELGDREREGIPLLRAAFPQYTMDEAFTLHWKRNYRGNTESRAKIRPRVLMLQFIVHAVNIDQLLKTRAAA